MRLKTVSTKSNNNYAIIADYKKLNGKKSTYVYENLGNDQNLKERFGTENTMDKVKEYINSLNQMIKDGKELPVNLTLNPNKQIEKNINRCFYSGHFFLRKIYYDLGIDKICKNIKDKYKFTFDINAVVECLLYARIIWPSSKLSTFEQSRKFIGNYDFDLQHVYRTLTYLSHEINTIQKELFDNSSKVIDRNYKVIYYDCTNYFFYTEENDFQRYGISKQHQPNPLVQMGLFIDNNGIPVSHKLFPGNTQDKTTFKNVLENDVDDMDLGRIVVVADNGMNTQENKYLIVNKNNGYIVSKSVKKSWKKMGPWALDNTDYTEIKNSFGDVVFKYKSRINEVELTYKKEDGTKNKKKVKEKEIIYWSKKHYEKEVNQNRKFIEYLESCKAHPDKLKDKERKSQQFIKTVDIDKETGEVIHPEKVIVFLDEKLKKYKETMGFYSIVTSEIEEDDREIINRYHGLSRIEDSFRIIKSDLEGRPIYVWTEEHIKAHFLICFIALTIIRIMQYKILKYENKSTLNVDGWEQGITAEKIKDELNCLEADPFDENSYKLRKPTDIIIKLLNIYEYNFDFKLPSKQDIVLLKNHIFKRKI